MVIEDLEYDTVTEMLNFIYCGRCLRDVNEFSFASDLLIAADKYRLEELKSHCEKALVQVNFHLALLNWREGKRKLIVWIQLIGQELGR